ncbi:MAG: hypothetical protein ACRYGK_17220 [Janthinobacterium lividum]
MLKHAGPAMWEKRLGPPDGRPKANLPASRPMRRRAPAVDCLKRPDDTCSHLHLQLYSTFLDPFVDGEAATFVENDGDDMFAKAPLVVKVCRQGLVRPYKFEATGVSNRLLFQVPGKMRAGCAIGKQRRTVCKTPANFGARHFIGARRAFDSVQTLQTTNLPQ